MALCGLWYSWHRPFINLHLYVYNINHTSHQHLWWYLYVAHNMLAIECSLHKQLCLYHVYVWPKLWAKFVSYKNIPCISSCMNIVCVLCYLYCEWHGPFNGVTNIVSDMDRLMVWSVLWVTWTTQWCKLYCEWHGPFNGVTCIVSDMDHSMMWAIFWVTWTIQWCDLYC